MRVVWFCLRGAAAAAGSGCSRLGLARGVGFGCWPGWAKQATGCCAGWAKALVGHAANELGLQGVRRAGGARRGGGLSWAAAAARVGRKELCWTGCGDEQADEAGPRGCSWPKWPFPFSPLF